MNYIYILLIGKFNLKRFNKFPLFNAMYCSNTFCLNTLLFHCQWNAFFKNVVPQGYIICLVVKLTNCYCHLYFSGKITCTLIGWDSDIQSIALYMPLNVCNSITKKNYICNQQDIWSQFQSIKKYINQRKGRSLFSVYSDRIVHVHCFKNVSYTFIETWVQVKIKMIIVL